MTRWKWKKTQFVYQEQINDDVDDERKKLYKGR